MRKNNIQEMKTIDAPSTLHRSYDENDTTNAQKQWISFAFWLLTRQNMICIRNKQIGHSGWKCPLTANHN